MSDKIMLNFRCPSSMLEVIDNLGKERYPANTKHGCDRSKTLIDIMRAGIQALSDGSVVLPAPEEVRQQSSDVKQSLSDSSLEARITEIVQRQTEPLFAEKFSALEERLGKLSAANDGGGDESLRQQLKQTEEHLAEVTRDRDELKQQLTTLTAFRAQLAAELASRQQLQAELDRTREELKEVKAENEATKRQYLDLLDTSANRVKELQAQQSLLQQRLDAAEQNPDSAIDSIDPYIFLDWLKGLIKGKSKKPPQWEPTKADAEAILARARQS